MLVCQKELKAFSQDIKQAKKHAGKSVTLFGDQSPLTVTTAVPQSSVLLATTPKNKDTSALQLAMHDLEKSVLGQKNTIAGRAESPKKPSVVGVGRRIRLGNRRYLLEIILLVSGAERKIISRQTIFLDGVLIKNLGMKSVMGGHSV
jgi:hypothetical protein